MRRPRRPDWLDRPHVLAAAAASVVGLAGAALGVFVVSGLEPGSSTAVSPGDRAEGAIAELRESSVYVAPDGRSMMPRAAERRLEAVIAEAPVAVHVLVWRASDQDGNSQMVSGLTTTIADELDVPGVTIVWQGPEDAAAGTRSGERIGWDSVRLEPAGDPEQRITEYVEGLSADSVEPDRDPEYWSAIGGAITVGAIAGLLLGAVTWAVLGLVRRRTGRPFRNRLPGEG